MSPTALRWGILGLGGISSHFVSDLLTPPSDRGVSDVKHILHAVGSSSTQKAHDFLKKHGAPSEARAYGSYGEVLRDEGVQVVYIGTPHSHHYANAKDALESGKHVLLEKPATVNAEQAKALVALAKEKGLFFMEAQWTRFFPIAKDIQRAVREGEIGQILQVHADFGLQFGDLPPTHRMMDPNLAGGSFLDLGPYPLMWILMTLYHHPDNHLTRPVVAGAVIRRTSTNVDESTTALLNFPALGASAIASTNMAVASLTPLLIKGTKGEIVIPELPLSRPESYELRLPVSSHKSSNERNVEKRAFPIPHHGMHWQADEVARCIAAGKTESDVVPWSETVLTADIFDEIRRRGELVYPEGVEAV